MSSGCGDVLSLADLQTAKKHQIFEAEVITGKQGGVAGGADIDFATNLATGQTQKTLPAVLRDAGFLPADFTFATGGTLGVNDANKAVMWPAPGGNGLYYSWHGALPKVIPAGSSPATAGGESPTAWRLVGDIGLKIDLASVNGGGLVGLVPSGTVQDAIGWVTPEMFDGINDSERLQSAVTYASANGLSVIADGSYTVTAPINVAGSVVILARSGEFNFSGVDYIFHLVGANSFELHGGKFTATTYVTDRPQIVFNDYPDGRNTFPTRVIIKDTNSFNCGIAYLLVDGAKSTNYVNISGNLVTTDSLTDSYVSGLGLPDNRAKAYLSIIGESAKSVNIGVPRAPMWNISDNSFDTFMQTGYNMDLVKIGGSTLGGSASGNMFRNRNTESFSEVDTFTGGLEVTFTNNRFENISFKLETLKFFTGPRLGEGGRSVISNNVMHFSKNPLMDYGMWLLSPQVVVNSNVIYYEGADDPLLQRPFTGIYFREGDTIDTPDFGGLPPYACTVSNNTIEIKTGVISKDLRVQTINTSEMEGCTITGNTFFGGNSQVFSNRRANMRNLWTGNYLSSTQFNGNDIYRMQSQMVGAGNYVGSGKNFNNTPAAKVTQDIPAQTNGTTIYVNLAQTFDIPTNETKSLYALTVVTSCPTMLNRQVFLISSGVHDAQEALACLDSRFDRNSNDPTRGQYVFKLQWTPQNTMQLVANKPYLSTSTPPTKVEYMITALTGNLL